MKILYVGHYKEKSGWGDAARNWIKALNSAGIDVVPRPVILSGGAEYDETIAKLEKKSSIGCTHVIQHVLPQYMCYDSSLKNIGIFIWETLNVPKMWEKYVRLMDEVWVANSVMQAAVKQTLDIKSSILPHAFVDDWHNEKHTAEPFNNFCFYTICELNHRKNLDTMIKAFHSEFYPHELVNLVIKTNAPDSNAGQKLQNDINRIKTGLRIYPKISDYKNDTIIAGHVSRKELIKIHNSCDCYVSASHGEACNMPLWEAAIHGIPSIGVSGTGEEDMSTYTVRSQTSICYRWETIDGYASGRDFWVDVNEESLRNCMRSAYEHKLNVSKTDKYSIQNVGLLMKDLLNE